MAEKKHRNANGTFKRIHPGYKPKGVQYKTLYKMLKEKEPEVLEKVVAMALDGNIQALTLLWQKLYGSGAMPNGVGLIGKSTVEQIVNLNGDIISGEIAASDAGPLLDVIRATQRSVELESIKKELIELQDSKNV